MIKMTRFGRWLAALLVAWLPGPGDAFELPILYADLSNARIVTIDPVTGDRVTLSGAGVGSGPAFSSLVAPPQPRAARRSRNPRLLFFPADDHQDGHRRNPCNARDD